MRVVVVALGKIGLPLAVQFASKGHDVVGVDIDDRVVESVNAGAPPFPGEERLGDLLADAVASGRLTATSDYADAVPSAEVIVVVVPLFVDAAGKPDFRIMDRATEAIGSRLAPGTLVAYETTLPVGTTRSRLAPLLEAKSGLTEGDGFHIVFSPERVFTGRVFEDLRKYPKLIGALSEEGARRARAFYESALDFDPREDLSRENGVWDLGTAEAAELAKLAETTYRDVNIGLANQFARFATKSGIDIYSVIEASNSQPFSHIHRPGIAVGGHCIPVYPMLYLANDPEATVVASAREANASMPQHAVEELQDTYGDLGGARIAVLGASYRGGVKEAAFSGVFPVVAALLELNAHVEVHDPLFSEEELRSLGFTPYRLGSAVDAAVVQTDHVEYRSLRPADLPGVKVLMDGRRITDPALWAGVTRRCIGVGSPAQA